MTTPFPIPPNAICGHCGQERRKHFFEDQVYCFRDTSGDLWSDEPSHEDIGHHVEAVYPELWTKIIKEWKEENGHTV